ncbi:sure-like protein [Schizopora paradoxa]|uniref:Sure-like protein n=1 Tax=Schizopora paradoxa TaxID=27342 RepID=A0A0H2ST04_9AGAM|nr:sure-like protein [Schizopora paradoxa]
MSATSIDIRKEDKANGPKRLRVLLTNDDGPPGLDSPYIYGFAQRLVKNFDWDVKVVIPNAQKSWIGKAFHIKEVVRGSFYYPTGQHGVGESTSSSRPLKHEEGEFTEWILLDGTPATCTNIGLHNLFKDEIDLVISGPNLGRNSSTAFALSSGTIGAALSGALSGIRAIAVSYGTVKRPVPSELHEHAHDLSCRIIARLLASWPQPSEHGYDSTPELYNINIPMVDELLPERGGMRVVWTNMWRSRYGKLFKAIQEPSVAKSGASASDVQAGGPDAAESTEKTAQSTMQREPSNAGSSANSTSNSLTFKFAPDAEFQHLISPPLEHLPVGSDGWAIAQNWASVTPLCASFAEPGGVDFAGEFELDGMGAKPHKL